MRLDPRISEKIAFALIGISISVVIFAVTVILYYIISNGYTALSWSFLTEMPRSRMTEGGIFLRL